MKGLARFSVVIPALFLMLFLLGPGVGYSDIAENMRFDPLPRPGDTMVSGTCDQTQGCNGPLGVGLRIGGDTILTLGEGSCVDGRFTINLCQPVDSFDKNPTICVPYALQAGDVIDTAQWVEIIEDEPCDHVPWFTVGMRGIPTVTQWGVVILSILLALSAIVLIRKRRARLD